MTQVALLHYSAPPVVGGVEAVLGQHARLIANDGFQVRIIAGRGEQMDPRVAFERLALAGSRHPQVLALKAELDKGHVPGQFEPLVSGLGRHLRRALAGIDVLVAHNVCSLHKNLALTAALRRLIDAPGAPRLIVWHHDLAWTAPRYRDELHPGYPWDLLRQAWPGVTHVAVSELRRQELAALLGVDEERIQVIPNGVDRAAFLKLEAETIGFLRRLDLEKANPLLLLPVRITPRKNIELALRILAALRAGFPEAALLVTGPLGPHNPANRAYFRRLLDLRDELGLHGRAHFLAEFTQAGLPAAEASERYLPDAVIADFYRLADALLLPSQEEGFGIPLLEAGLARLPVFCSDIPPLRALGEGVAQFFAPDADPAGVAGAIARRLSADAAFHHNRRVRACYTWEGVYNRQIRPLLDSACEAR